MHGVLLCVLLPILPIPPQARPAPAVPAQATPVAFEPATPESQGLSSAALAALVAEVDAFLERDMFVGAELLVIKNRRTVLHRFFGSLDREKHAAWVDGTICNIRSMTKTLTGAAAQLLIDRGELFLDDRVADLLPGFDTGKAGAITVQQLLTHRAGLPLTIITSKLDEFANLIDQANAIGARGPEYEPGSRFWYSDAGTDAVGAIVEIVSGMKLDEFVREELLVPLGMTESFYYLDGKDPRRARIASAYIGGPGNWRRFFDPAAGALYPFAWGSQSLYSTPVDYAKFLAMWMDGGRVGDRVVLSPDAVARTLTAVSEMSMLGSDARFPTSFTGLDVHYGQMAVLHLPIASAGAGPATIVGHSGSDGTIAWAWPERDLMILFFTQSRGGAAVLRLEEPVDRLLISPEAYADAPEPPAELRPYLGVYIADWKGHMQEEFAVVFRNGQLALDVPSQLIFELRPAEVPGRWTAVIEPAMSLWFDRDDAGVVDCLRVQEGALVFEAPRKGSAHAKAFAEQSRPDPAVIGRYLGAYHDPDTAADFEIVLDRDNLAVRDAEGALFHLWKVPDRDEWRVRANLQVAFRFQEEAGRVVSVTRKISGSAPLVMPRVK